MGNLKALVFDVDGTLYPQGPLRRAMLLRLLRAHWYSPVRGWNTLRVLKSYRDAQERLRGDASLGVDQFGEAPEASRNIVRRWMEEEPLEVLPPLVHDGLESLLRLAQAAGLKLGVFSDYPAEKKLRAMGLDKYFDAVVSAQDPEVLRFKPDARGLEVTLRRLGVEKADALYVGDRADVDGAAAAAAGVDCLILGTPGARDYGEIMGTIEGKLCLRK